MLRLLPRSLGSTVEEKRRTEKRKLSFEMYYCHVGLIKNWHRFIETGLFQASFTGPDT